MPKNKKYPNISNKNYHSGTELSCSGLKLLEQSAAHYQVQAGPKNQGRLDLGSGGHTAILEPDKFESEYLVLKEGKNFTHVAGKELKKQALKEGKTALSYRDHARIKSMQKAVFRHPTAKHLLREGEAEASYYWDHPEFPNVRCRCRPDFYNIDKVVIDFKTVRDARKDEFQKKIANLLYHLQAAWYLDGVSAVTGEEHTLFAFIIVEIEPPHGVGVFFASEDMIEAARERITPLVEKYNRCVLDNHWPCYPQDAEVIDLPRWAK